MVDNDISDYHDVTSAIHMFGNNEERLMTKVEDGTLQSGDFTEE